MKSLQLTLNNTYIESIIKELENMKTNHNKIIKIANAEKTIAVVITHEDSDIHADDNTE